MNADQAKLEVFAKKVTLPGAKIAKQIRVHSRNSRLGPSALRKSLA
jgi:hypothetical protein